MAESDNPEERNKAIYYFYTCSLSINDEEIASYLKEVIKSNSFDILDIEFNRVKDKPVKAICTKRILPSIPAAIVAGAIGMPLCVLGCKFIENEIRNQFVLFLWCLITFALPVLFATVDFKYFARRRRETVGMFRRFFFPFTSIEDFSQYYLTGMGRMFICFVSAVASMIILNALGIEF